MKTSGRLVLIGLVVLLATSCKNDAQPELKTVEVAPIQTTEKTLTDPNARFAKVEFSIEGMTCEMGCAKTIERKMAKMDGVKSAKVDFKKELAMVEYDEAKVTAESLEETVKKAGEVYTVKDLKIVAEFSEE